MEKKAANGPKAKREKTAPDSRTRPQRLVESVNKGCKAFYVPPSQRTLSDDRNSASNLGRLRDGLTAQPSELRSYVEVYRKVLDNTGKELEINKGCTLLMGRVYFLLWNCLTDWR